MPADSSGQSSGQNDERAPRPQPPVVPAQIARPTTPRPAPSSTPRPTFTTDRSAPSGTGTAPYSPRRSRSGASAYTNTPRSRTYTMMPPPPKPPKPPAPSPPAELFRLPPMLSWQEFLNAAQSPETIPDGLARHGDPHWAGAGWDEAVRLAIDGWPQPLAETHLRIADLRERAGLGMSAIALEPVWDVAGAEVDIGVYLSGVPECMVDSVPRRVSRRGKVVTFLLPAGYSKRAGHEAIRNRGLALATLCSAIIGAGHSVEIWSVDTGRVGPNKIPYSAAARVITAGEPLDVGRLVFAAAHAAMLRRLWFAVWDGQPAQVARTFRLAGYGAPPFSCGAQDLPPEITEPYVFPYLEANEPQWRSLDSALDWCHGMFADLGLIQPT